MHDGRLRHADAAFFKHCNDVSFKFDNLQVQLTTKFHEVQTSLKSIPTNDKIEQNNIKFKQMIDDLSALTTKKKEFETEKDKAHRQHLAIKNDLKMLS